MRHCTFCFWTSLALMSHKTSFNILLHMDGHIGGHRSSFSRQMDDLSYMETKMLSHRLFELLKMLAQPQGMSVSGQSFGNYIQRFIF